MECDATSIFTQILHQNCTALSSAKNIPFWQTACNVSPHICHQHIKNNLDHWSFHTPPDTTILGIILRTQKIDMVFTSHIAKVCKTRGADWCKLQMIWKSQTFVLSGMPYDQCYRSHAKKADRKKRPITANISAAFDQELLMYFAQFGIKIASNGCAPNWPGNETVVRSLAAIL